jgi:hypothetical protein
VNVYIGAGVPRRGKIWIVEKPHRNPVTDRGVKARPARVVGLLIPRKTGTLFVIGDIGTIGVAALIAFALQRSRGPAIVWPAR